MCDSLTFNIFNYFLRYFNSQHIIYFSLLDAYNPCHSNPCGHDGTCESLGQAYRCKCAGDYIGETCDGKWQAVSFTLSTNSGSKMGHRNNLNIH